MIIKHGRHVLEGSSRGRKGMWALFLDCAFQMLIGWTGKVRSRGCYARECHVFTISVHVTSFDILSVVFMLISGRHL